MRNKVIALLFACTALLVFAVPTFAWQSRLEGNPGVTSASALGYYLWHDSDGLHVRTHGPGTEHVFSARFHTDGVIQNLSPIRLEADDQNYLENGGHDLVIYYHTYDGIDGVNFDIDGGSVLTGLADLDSTRISTADIFLGASGDNPLHNPFVLPR
ncbi:MAG TPA: hypothetical protein VKV73_30350 [Chloroflexota bacterium]|nr:hypothetical protein [Chloroflexota bacterium]